MILACDTPGLKQELARAYSRPPDYQHVVSVPDYGTAVTLLVVALVTILLLKRITK